MKLPNKLKIGGHLYKVELVDSKSTDINGGNLCARLNRNKGTIFINKEMIQSEQEVALFHEVFHVINNQFSEETTESLSQQIYQVLKDNNLLN